MTDRIEPRPAVAFLRQHPELAKVKVEGSTLISLARQQPTFAVEHRTARRNAQLVPQTAAAAALLAGDTGRTFSRMVRGAIGSLDAREGAAQVMGISFGTSPEGFTANRLLREHEESFDLLSLPANQRRREVVEYLRNGTEAAKNGTGAATIDGRTPGTTFFEVGPRVTSALTRMAAGELPEASPDLQRAVQVIAHELEHAVTPHDFNRRRLPELEWLEEGVATVIAGSPKGHARVAEAMGIKPVWSEDFLRNTHPQVSAGTLDLLSLAGIDVRSDSGFEMAEQTLQARPLEDVPEALAHVIAQKYGLPPALLPKLTAKIVDTQGNQKAVSRLSEWVSERRDGAS